MNKTGLSRPGAKQMLFSALILALAGVAPYLMAARQPNQEWLVNYSGLPALLVMLAGVFFVVMYFTGFLKYCASKGFSKWLGFWLFLGQFPGLIALLILPDLYTYPRAPVQGVTYTRETAGSP